VFLRSAGQSKMKANILSNPINLIENFLHIMLRITHNNLQSKRS
jgi:hypothetical protein